MIWVASAKRLLGRSACRPLRRKCNRIGGPARQAFRSRTISASPTFLNASRRPFLSHQFWSQPNDSAIAQPDFRLARQPRLRRLPAQRRPSWLSGLRRRRPAPWLIPGQAGSDRSDYGREYLIDGRSQMETYEPLKSPEIRRDENGRFDRHGKTLAKTQKKVKPAALQANNNREKTGQFKRGHSGNPEGRFKPGESGNPAGR